MSEQRTYYDTLQVSRLSSESVIKAAYRVLSQKFHPDKHPERQAWANEQMKRLNEAYEVLSDPVRRANYDSAIAEAERRSHADHPARKPFRQAASPPNTSTAAQDPSAQRSATPSDSSARNHRWQDDGRGRASESKPRGSVADALNGLTVRIEAHNRKYDHLQIWGNRFVVVVAVAAGSYQLARWTARRFEPSFEQLGVVDALARADFLGMLVVNAAALSFAGAVAWTAALLLRKSAPTRVVSATVGVLLAFVVLLFGDSQGKARLPHAVRGADAPATAAATAAPNVSAPAANLDRGALDRERAALRLRNPVINPQHFEYSSEAEQWVDEKIARYLQQGSPPAAAVRQAEADLNAAIQEHAAKYRQQQEQRQRPLVSAAPPSIGEKLTMGMACGDIQMSGDIARYRSCVANQEALHRATGSTPSYSDLPFDEQVTIGMACDQYQTAGDLAGYKNCIRAQLSKIGR